MLILRSTDDRFRLHNPKILLNLTVPLYDFSKSQIIHHDGFCCVAGKVNSADKLYLVIESVKRDTQHQLDSNALAPAERAGGRPL